MRALNGMRRREGAERDQAALSASCCPAAVRGVVGRIHLFSLQWLSRDSFITGKETKMEVAIEKWGCCREEPEQVIFWPLRLFLCPQCAGAEPEGEEDRLRRPGWRLSRGNTDSSSNRVRGHLCNFDQEYGFTVLLS